MTIYILNGTPIDSHLWQTVGQVQYPPGWFDNAGERTAHGLELLFDTTPPVITSVQRRTVTGYTRDGQNRWVAVWAVTDKTDTELAADAAAHADAASLSWERIKAERDGPRTEGGVTVGGYWFHTDTASRIKWLGLKDSARDRLLAGALPTEIISVDGGPVAWKTMGSTFAPVSIQLALDVVEATKVLDKQLFVRAEQHHALMLLAADPASYDYSTGWPTRFVPT